jgi:Short C-terminal domain
MLRRPVGRRGPGLVRTMAATAVVAGTATAVNTRTQDRHHRIQMEAQDEMAAQQAAFDSQQQLQQMQAQMAAMQAQQAKAAAGAAGGADFTAQLQQLAQMKQSGVLSEAEFEAAKAKLLR